MELRHLQTHPEPVEALLEVLLVELPVEELFGEGEGEALAVDRVEERRDVRLERLWRRRGETATEAQLGGRLFHVEDVEGFERLLVLKEFWNVSKKMPALRG